jgi:hypothetical protein
MAYGLASFPHRGQYFDAVHLRISFQQSWHKGPVDSPVGLRQFWQTGGQMRRVKLWRMTVSPFRDMSSALPVDMAALYELETRPEKKNHFRS